MLRQHDAKLRLLLSLLDAALCGTIFLCVGALAPVAFATHRGGLIFLGLAATLTLPLALRASEGLQSTRLESLVAVSLRMLAAGGVSMVVLAAAAFVSGAAVPPHVLLACVAAQLGAVGLTRLTILSGLRVLRRRGRNYRNVVVIGTGPRARDVTSTIARHPEWGLRVIGYVDEGDVPLDPSIPQERVHKMVDFRELLRDEVIDEVITACPRSMLATIGPAVEACGAAGIPLTVMSDLFGDYLPPPTVKLFASHAALTFAPVHHSRAMLGFKRAIDAIGAGLGLLVAAPVVALAALAIRATSPGPIFFRQIRCGLYGRPFLMLKLRTMTADAEVRQGELLHLNEMDGPVFKIKSDPRITPVGQFLRIFSIDELPQLWNVLVGDMSLVGPRPPIPSEVARYETSERRRLSMRPGLTCLWQVSGRNEIGFEEWVKLDLQYIDHWSLASDLKIMAMTVPTVLRGSGA